MKIVYLVTCFTGLSTGNGGVYFSLRAVAEAMRSHPGVESVEILTIGNARPVALEGVGVPVHHVDVTFADTLLGRWLNRVPNRGWTHVHAFERGAVLFGQALARREKARFYLTKPGGPNSRYFPFAEDLLFFSRENLEHEASRPMMAGARMHHLPQRVTPASIDQARIDLLRASLPADSPNLILRIARIGPYYEHSIRQTLTLARRLRGDGIPATALILGTVQDQEIADRLAGELEPGEHLVTDPRFTRAASELIPIARFVVGTGRSLMEAAIAGVPVAAPTANGTLPLLLDEDNFEALQQTNFSERFVAEEAAIEASYARIASLLTDPDAYIAAADEAREIAEAQFDVQAALPRYAAIYAQPQSGKSRLLDRILPLREVWRGLNA